MALSYSLFILCMDPLIRKMNSDNEIEGLNIGINFEYNNKKVFISQKNLKKSNRFEKDKTKI